MWQKLFISVVISVITCNQASAVDIFRSEFENGLLKYVGSGNPYPGGGGFVNFLGGEIGTYYTPSDGCGGLSVQDVVMDSSSAAQGGPGGAQTTALKTQYNGPDCGQSFQKNTTIIKFPPQKDVYVRFYQKWSSGWIWPTIQQKFAKIANQDKTSSQNFYFKHDGEMRVNYVKLGKQTTTFTPQDDDLSSSATITMPTNQWHEVQMHVKMSDPGKSNGVLEYWINGVKYFGLYNIENNKGSTSWLNHIELQHVYETGSPKTGPSKAMPTWMKNIVVSTTFIPGDCPKCPKPNPQFTVDP